MAVRFLLLLAVASLSFSAAFADICLICDCVFVNITRVEPKPGDFVSFQYRTDAVEPFHLNATHEPLHKYFHVDCSSESSVGQINNLDWPKLKVLGILADFHGSKWKRLEAFPEAVKRQMTVLSLSNNLIAEIDEFELDDFAGLRMLNLSGNQVQVVRKGAFNRLSLLRIADLSANWLTQLEDWAFYGTDLQYLNLSKNGLTHVTSDVFRGLNNLTVLDLSENRLTKLPDDFGNSLPSLAWLSLGKNALQRLPELPKDLKQFDVSENQLIDLHLAHLSLQYLNIGSNELRSLTHTNFPALEVLMAAHNNLSDLSDLPSARISVLDLSHNAFRRVPDAITSDDLPLLRELYLDGNPIANLTFPPQSEPFSDLRVLGLSHLKSLKKILRNSFQGVFPNVKYDCSRDNGISLDLSHNSIKFIDEEAFKTISICRIDLSRNHLKSLPKDLLPWLTLTHVNLQDNPWQCDCNIQWMLDDLVPFVYENSPRHLFGMRCSTPLRFKNRMFVFWYNKSENVFCSSGPSSFFIDLAENKKVVWTASAITCVLLGCIIVITGIVIIVLVCTKPSKKKKTRTAARDILRQGPPYYKQIQHNASDQNKGYSEKCV